MRFTRRRLVTGVTAVTAAAAGLAGVRAAQARYYTGDLSDHFDGLRFIDPHGVPPKGIPDLLRWWSSRAGRALWSDLVPSPYADTPPPRVDGSNLRVSFIGHASLLLQTGGLNILIDPVWSDRVSPVDFVGPKRGEPAGRCVRGAAEDRHRSALAQSLRPSRHRDAVAPRRGSSPARDHAARQRTPSCARTIPRSRRKPMTGATA
jgi:hypothetical protein